MPPILDSTPDIVGIFGGVLSTACIVFVVGIVNALDDIMPELSIVYT